MVVRTDGFCWMFYGYFVNVISFNVIMDGVLLMIDHYVELLIDVLR